MNVGVNTDSVRMDNNICHTKRLIILIHENDTQLSEMTFLVNFGRSYDHNVDISAHRLGEDGKVRVWLETNILPTNHPMQVLKMATSDKFQNLEV